MHRINDEGWLVLLGEVADPWLYLFCLRRCGSAAGAGSAPQARLPVAAFAHGFAGRVVHKRTASARLPTTAHRLV